MGQINIRKRGNVYEYFFEGAKVNNKRTRISKSGFKTKNEAYEYGYRAYEEYNNGGIKRESQMCYAELVNYKEQQDRNKKEFGKKYKYYSLKEVKNKYGKVVEYVIVESKSKKDRVDMVFTKRDGSYSGTDVIKYPFKIIRNELGIKARFYDLRGSFATTSLRNGCEIKDIAEVLGHRRIETTEKYYISSTEKDKRQVSKCFENSLKIFNNII